MELEDIPLEQFTDFCESLDNRELFKLSQTNRQNYLICKNILNQRKVEESERLVSKLVGNWYTKPDEYGWSYKTIITSREGYIRVKSTDFRITSNWLEWIPKTNVSYLSLLRDELSNYDYVRR